MQFIWFLGRFHVLIVHLPLGMLTLAVVLEILVRFRPFRFLRDALAPAWIAGAISALATVALGLMHATEDSFEDMPAVDAHGWAGMSLAAAACLTALLRTRLHPPYPQQAAQGREGAPGWAGPEGIGARLYRAVQPAFAPGAALDRAAHKLRGIPVAAVLFLMLLTGHLGGSLTHGDTYLLQYAPGAVRVLAGLPADAGPRPKPADVASADIYLDVVQPALDRRCLVCHNGSKKSGGLSVASYETLMKGGSKGAVITAGNLAASDLLRRVNLAPGRSDFMPKDGKTPLNKNEITAIGWWISQGAPKNATVGDLKPTPEASSAIAAVIGTAGEEGEEGEAPNPGGPDEGPPLPQVAEADTAAVAKVVAQGFIVRKVAMGSNLVDVDYASAEAVTPAMINDLARFGPNILRLNLRHAGVTDAEIKTIAGFSNLRRLRLEENAITDAAAEDIAGLKDLTYLNLTNTKVTDAGFAQVSTLPKLSRVYIWETAVTPAAVDKVKALCKDVTIYAGLTARDVPTEPKIMTPAN
jgi:Planctomycete cytochrome C/Leucine rich repeat